VEKKNGLGRSNVGTRAIFAKKRRFFMSHLQEVTAAISTSGKTVPEMRNLSKTGFSFSSLPIQEQMAVWDGIWRGTTDFHVKMQAYFYMESLLKRRDLLPTIWAVTQPWQDGVDNWCLCDSLAKIFTKVLEVMPDEVYPTLAAWNTSPSLWHRRQSVVSLLYFSRTKKVLPTFGQITALVLPLLGDDEYYVQKGVGWTLREMHTVYPEPTMEFARRHVAAIHPIAFTILLEKMTEAEKTGLKELRAAGRVKRR
jgi:DNA alkylation repair enzyme